MKQSLSLKLGQQVTMTPQLQQAIRLLQLSSLDLQQEIQTALEENPMLELEEEEPTEHPGDATDVEPSQPEAELMSAGEDSDLATVDEDFEQPIPDDLPVDTDWEDIYQPPASTPAGSNDEWSGERPITSAETLQDHLLWQLNLTPMAARDRVVATAIIDAINPDGMLTVSVAELCDALQAPLQDAQEVAGQDLEEQDVEAVLQRVQQFDPIGIGARDLGECLSLQLQQLPDDARWKQEALTLVTEHLNTLAARDFATLKRKTKLDESELAAVVALIQSLNPRPGSAIAAEETEYVVPDVIVTKSEGRWQVRLNQEATPAIRINDTYASLVKRADSSADGAFLRDNLQEAKWFLKSLQSRNETLLKVATRIVEHQRGFLEYGEEAMKPLVLHDIADAVDMHESTISRVTSRKYMHTPRGIFEFKYFFSSHVGTADGGECSATAIRAMVRKLIAEENRAKPLSDNKIANILVDKGINVARRTVAKYREAMAIPPSNERKRLA